MAGARVLRFGVVVALALTLLAGWHLVREPDFNRIQVGTLEDFESRYRYDGNAFWKLTQVIERAAGQPFARELRTRIIQPLGLAHTAPNPGDPHGFRSLVAS